jgi:hypothetical protein
MTITYLSNQIIHYNMGFKFEELTGWRKAVELWTTNVLENLWTM